MFPILIQGSNSEWFKIRHNNIMITDRAFPKPYHDLPRVNIVRNIELIPVHSVHMIGRSRTLYNMLLSI